MKSCRLLILVAILGAVSMPNARAGMITVWIDGNSADVPVHVEDGDYVVDDGFTFQTVDGKIKVSGDLSPDYPYIIFGGTAKDFGAPSTFRFTFNLPFSHAVSNPSVVSDSFTGSVTNGAVDNSGMNVTALGPPPGIPTDADGVTEMEVYTLSSDGGATWQNVGLDLGPSQFVPTNLAGSGTYGPALGFNGGPIATTPGGPWTNMRADISFSLAGGNDEFTMNGAKVLEAAVPEPASICLLLIALASACLHQRNRSH